MAELTLKQHLEQIDHAVDGMRTTDDQRDVIINGIQKKIRGYIAGITRVQSKQMHMAILAGLDELGPEIDRLACDVDYPGNIGNRDTDPAPDMEIEIIPGSEKRPKTG